ncbi:MAG: hypothetical protein EBR62_08965 [Verrucomicrobia bacterium]|jgi:hypothetical protein|nr:hypothetical protein [Verrucomicrobiota bacterium]
MKKLILPLLLVCSLVAFAADTKVDTSKFKDGGCCQKADKKGEKCNHPCCAKAAKDGKVCEKCNPVEKAEPAKK